MTPREVHDILAGIGVTHLHHANTVLTAQTFLEQGALVSRQFVEQNGLKQTPQDSDEIDKRYKVWDRVFLDHVNIHQRAGRVKGPNQYGPALFVLDLAELLRLPARSTIEVTKKNPIHWRKSEARVDQLFADADELRANICFGNFDKMLIIDVPGGKFNFPKVGLQVYLDNPKRTLATGVDAYVHAYEALTKAAGKKHIRMDLKEHECRSGCCCVEKYAGFGQSFFDSRFSRK